MTRSRWILAGVGALVVGVLAFGSGALTPDSVSRDVATATVRRGPLEVTLLEAGEIRAARDEKVVAPRVRGDLKIVHLWPEGETVEVGDLILQFDRSEYEQRVKDRAGDLEQAKEDRRKVVAQQKRRRADLLMEVEQAQAALELSRISLQKAE